MAKKRFPVSEGELESIISNEIQNSDGFMMSQLSAERGENMDFYQTQPFGNEVDGRSSVVSPDVRDTLEWMIPQFVRIFTSGDQVVEFEPQSEQDVAAAKQATEYVNYIFMRDNPGFLILYSWIKDALLSKNGIVKIWWDETPEQKRERYYGLPDDSFAELLAPKEVEVAEHTEREETVTQIVPNPQTGQLEPQSQPITVHDVVVTRTKPRARVCIVNVPPEEFLISRDARDIANARFVGHRRRIPISDLIEEGYDAELLDHIGSDDTSIPLDAEEIKRNTVENFTAGTTASNNKSMRMLWVTEGYIRVDVDGDGIAEMRKVVVAGPSYKILSNEPWDTDRPFASMTPIIMPHRFWGMAIADLVKPIQLIKSTILRQYLDNLYLANNQREQVIEKQIVDPSEVLSSAPGRKIRITGPGPAVFPIEVPAVGGAALEGLSYIDQIRENETGVSPRTQGLGTNQLHDTAAGERMLMTAAMGKQELIARVFAETGISDAFRMILRLVCQYQDKPRVIQLTKNWVPMDPSRWNEDMSTIVHVGLGMGDRDMQMQAAMALSQAQQLLMPMGMVTPQNAMSTAEVLVNALGFKGADRFFSLPQPQQQPHPDPKMVEAQGKLQIEGQKAQAHVAIENAKAQGKMAVDTQKAKTDALLGAQKQVADQKLAAFQAQQKAALQEQQIQAEIALKAQQIQMDHQLDRENAAAQNFMASKEQEVRLRTELPRSDEA